MKIEKKYIWAGLIGLVTISGAIAYLQYKKLMNYVIKFKSLAIRKIDYPNFNLDVFLDFTNNSDLKIDIKSQEYSVYINSKIISKLQNKATNTINPKSTSVIGVNVQFNINDIYKALGSNPSKAILESEKTKIKIDIKLKVSLYGITISIPYTYETSLKQLTNQ